MDLEKKSLLSKIVIIIFDDRGATLLHSQKSEKNVLICWIHQKMIDFFENRFNTIEQLFGICKRIRRIKIRFWLQINYRLSVQKSFKILWISFTEAAEVHVVHVLEVKHVAVGALLIEVVVPAVHEKNQKYFVSQTIFLIEKWDLDFE